MSPLAGYVVINGQVSDLALSVHGRAPFTSNGAATKKQKACEYLEGLITLGAWNECCRTNIINRVSGWDGE